MSHVKQKRTDEIALLRSGGNTIACGYFCSKCIKPVFPLRSGIPDMLLRDEERKILYDDVCEEVMI